MTVRFGLLLKMLLGRRVRPLGAGAYSRGNYPIRSANTIRTDRIVIRGDGPEKTILRVEPGGQDGRVFHFQGGSAPR